MDSYGRFHTWKQQNEHTTNVCAMSGSIVKRLCMCECMYLVYACECPRVCVCIGVCVRERWASADATPKQTCIPALAIYTLWLRYQFLLFVVISRIF